MSSTHKKLRHEDLKDKMKIEILPKIYLSPMNNALKLFMIFLVFEFIAIFLNYYLFFVFHEENDTSK